ncbi:Zinc finger protein [Fasciola hepatica]|uniref:Zinc finger protein n=1 Tax=Fasciola hepatica TaxID=6192 RepID=A0A2H1BWK4_FASHE|nr:Zinc finger protein [Fasciola hepatica]
MHANQQTLTSNTYAFGPAGMPQRHVQIIDPSTLPVVSDAQGQLIYEAVSSSSGAPTTQYIQASPNDTVIYNQPPVVLPQETSQNDMEIEPIDLEEVQKIQARMPAADPTAPIGSNKNPIRIIQQGNQYITTQDVSDEHLQQIIQVLTNQALISSSGSRPSAIYNRLTNRRIIFRVTRAKRRHDDIANSSLRVDRTKAAQAARAALRNRTPGKSNSRKRRKKGSDEDDPDFEPEVPEEEILPFPLARRMSTSGRVSKPPKHLVKDYRHLRLEDLTVKPESSEEDEHSNGGYSDYIKDGLSGEEDEYNEGSTKYPCPSCDKIYMSQSGLNKHLRTVHGVAPTHSKSRPVNPYVASMRRRAKLKEAVAEATDDDLIEFVAPRLSKLISPWDHLLLRSEEGDPPLPQVPRVVLDYLNLVERARAFLGDQLELRLPLINKLNPDLTKESQTGETNLGDITNNAETKSGDSAALSCAVTENGEAQNVPNDDLVEKPSDLIKPTDSAANGVEEQQEQEQGQQSPEKAVNESEKTDVVQQTDETRDEEEADDDDDSEDLDGGAIIIKIEKLEQSTALGLPCGKYVVKEPLCEDYLPRRFRSALATIRAQALSAGAAADAELGSDGQMLSKRRALVAMETADDDEVEATLRSDPQADDGTALLNEASASGGDGQTQGGVLTLGDELLLLPEGGLGGPVPDEWLTSGAFLTVLTETGETSDLVMEAATGRLFHKPTGHLVSLADGSTSQSVDQSQSDSQVAGEYGYEDEQRAAASTISSGSKVEQQNGALNETPVDQTEVIDPVTQQEQLLAQMAENGEVIDLNTLFPGVTVTEVSPGVCLVTKPNGDRFNVEHGGEGITLETLQTILQMDA